MSKIAEQKALEAYPNPQILPGFDSNKHYREGYIVGYDQAFQDFVEKAIRFLDKETVLADCKILQFKNYMENE